MTTRLFHRVDRPRRSTTVNGHAYSLDPNVPADAIDADVAELLLEGDLVRGDRIGTTEERLNTAPIAGLRFVDQTLQRALIADGSSWIDVVTGARV